MGILEGRRILVTGVLTDDSLAFGAARLAQEEGAEVALTGFGRGLSLTTRVARKLPAPAEVHELDVTVPGQAENVAAELERKWGALDGVVHAIGFAPESCLGKGVLLADWPDVSTAFEVSAYSLKVLAAAFTPCSAGPPAEGRSWASTSTPPWPGPDTTGWESRGGAGIARPLPRPRPRPEWHPRQPRRRRPGPDAGCQVDPRLRDVRERMGRARSARVGRARLRGGRPGVRGAAVGLVPADERARSCTSTAAFTPPASDFRCRHPFVAAV